MLTGSIFNSVRIDHWNNKNFCIINNIAHSIFRGVLINQTMAQRHWPDGDPVGEQVVLYSGAREVVGVVADTKDAGADQPDLATIFMPFLQREDRFMDWAVEASVPLSTLVESVRAEVSAMDPSVPAYDIMSMDDLIEMSLGGDLIMAKIMSVLAVISLILALGGVYGVMAYSVSQRTRELGIRMSLGAQRGNVMSMVVRQGMTLVGIGIVLGLGASWALTRLLRGMLYEVSPMDPLALTAGILLVSLTALLACYIPALRAARIDPMEALRYE